MNEEWFNDLITTLEDLQLDYKYSDDKVDSIGVVHGLNLAIDIIKEYETDQDLEYVVRCKDCDRSKHTAVGYVCTMTGASVASDGMGFCNNGRR